MSVICSTYVWELDNLTATEKLVLLKIADNAQDDGLGAFGSEKYMASRCGLTDRSVRNMLRSLEEKGELITRHKQGRETANGKTNAYILCGYRTALGLHPYLSSDSDYDKIRIFKTKTGGEKGRKDVPGGKTFRSRAERRSGQGRKDVPPEPSVEPSVEPSDNARGDLNSYTPSTPHTAHRNGSASPPPDAIALAEEVAAKEHFDPPADKTPKTPVSSRQKHPTPPIPPSPRYDGSKFKRGLVAAGQGETPVEVYYESFSINDDDTRLDNLAEDDLTKLCTDLERLREVCTAYRRTNYRKGNMQLILDWYFEGIPQKGKRDENTKRGNSRTHTQAGDVAPPIDPYARYANYGNGT